MQKPLIIKFIFWALVAILLTLIVKDAFTNALAAWFTGTLLLIPTVLMQTGLNWSLKFESFRKVVRLFFTAVICLYLAYIVIAFAYWYFMLFDSEYIDKSITNPFLLWVVMGFFTFAYYLIFGKDKKLEPNQERVTFYSNRKKVILPIDQILYIESLGEYTVIHLTNRDEMKNNVKIGAWEERLSSFLRIHRSFLINPVYATLQGQEIELSGSTRLSISRKYKKQVVEKMG